MPDPRYPSFRPGRALGEEWRQRLLRFQREEWRQRLLRFQREEWRQRLLRFQRSALSVP